VLTLIAGGGVIGSAIAYELSRAGVDVVLAERGRIGAGASSAAAGMLAPLAESSDPGPFFQLALDGMKAFDERARALIDESGIDFEFRRDGVLRVTESEEERDQLSALAGLQRENGGARWIEGSEVRRIEPAVSQTVNGALYSPADGHLNPARLTAALAAAAARNGARILEGQEVTSFNIDHSRILTVQTQSEMMAADHFVLAGGAWLTMLSERAGFPIPITPVRGQMLAVQATPPPIRHIVYSHSGYLVPKPDGSIWVGATEESTAGFEARVTVEGLHFLVSAAQRLVPALQGALYLRSWAGLRPFAPDRLPVLGTLPGLDNLHVAAGHFRNGILLSLVTGKLMAELILTGRCPEQLSAFSPSRFAKRFPETT
jgi:glycine oxidase